VTVEGTIYDVSGTMSGGLGYLTDMSRRWTAVSTDRLQQRASRRQAVLDELQTLHRRQRLQPTGGISARIDGRRKLLEIAENQKSQLVSTEHCLNCTLQDYLQRSCVKVKAVISIHSPQALYGTASSERS